jgi:hypothetical protein
MDITLVVSEEQPIISHQSDGHSSLAGSIAPLLDSVIVEHGVAIINARICVYIVSCGLPFTIVDEDTIFNQFLRLLRP